MWPFSKRDDRIFPRPASMLPKEVAFGKGCKWVPGLVFGDVVQLFSKNVCLPLKRFNDEGGETTWKDCSLRKWLNSECYQEFFSDVERNAMVSTAQVNAINTSVKAVHGYTLDDYIIIPTRDQITPFVSIGPSWRDDLFAFLFLDDSPCRSGYWLRTYDEIPSRYGSIMGGDPFCAKMPKPEERGAIVADNVNRCANIYTSTLGTPSHKYPIDACPLVSEWREVRMIVHVKLSYLLSAIR